MSDSRDRFPPLVTSELGGWRLEWFRLRPTGEGADRLAQLRAVAAREIAAAADPDGGLGPVGQEVRRLFRAAGCDPTRYRPSSEALARRVRKSGEVPAISPLVDLNNLLSLRLEVPCCVVDAGAVEPPFVLRAGRPGETMLSMRGAFDLAGKPVLLDRLGAFGTPITDAERVKVTATSGDVWLVAYLVEGCGGRGAAEGCLRELLAAAPVADLLG